MKTNTEHDTTRRAFLETCTAGLGAAGLGLTIPLPGNSAVPVSSPRIRLAGRSRPASEAW